MNIGELTATLGVDTKQLDEATNKFKKFEKSASASIDQVNSSFKNQKGIIEEIEETLSTLQERQKKAFKYEDIVRYNKKIAETKYYLKEYQTAGVPAIDKTKEQVSALQKHFTQLAAKIFTVVGAYRLLKNSAELLINSSQVLHDRWDIALSGVKASASVLGQEFINVAEDLTKGADDGRKSIVKWTDALMLAIAFTAGLGRRSDKIFGNIILARSAADKYTKTLQELEDVENTLIAPRAKALRLINEARSKGRDERLEIEERISLLKQAMYIEDEETKKALEAQSTRITALADLKKSYIDTGRTSQWTRAMERKYQMAIAETDNIQTRSYSMRRRAEMELRTLEREKLIRARMIHEMYASQLRAEEQRRQQSAMIENLEVNAPPDFRQFFLRTGGLEPPDQFVNLQKQLANAALMNQIFADSLSPVENELRLVQTQMSAYESAISSWLEKGIPQDEMFRSMVQELRALGIEYQNITDKAEELQQMNSLMASTIMSLSNSFASFGQGAQEGINALISSVFNLIDSLLALSLAQILATESKKGLLGVITGIIGVGLMKAVWQSNVEAQKMAMGGVVPAGYPNDTYPALLSSGEKVTPPNKLTTANENRDQRLYAFISNRGIWLSNKRYDESLNRTT